MGLKSRPRLESKADAAKDIECIDHILEFLERVTQRRGELASQLGGLQEQFRHLSGSLGDNELLIRSVMEEREDAKKLSVPSDVWHAIQFSPMCGTNAGVVDGKAADRFSAPMFGLLWDDHAMQITEDSHQVKGRAATLTRLMSELHDVEVKAAALRRLVLHAESQRFKKLAETIDNSS